LGDEEVSGLIKNLCQLSPRGGSVLELVPKENPGTSQMIQVTWKMASKKTNKYFCCILLKIFVNQEHGSLEKIYYECRYFWYSKA